MTPLDTTDTEPHQIPIDGILDLHAFAPKDAASVVKEYLRVCLEKGIYEVRIIHGKGTGTLRRTVHTLLRKHPDVSDFTLDSGPSSWGATRVYLHRPLNSAHP
ncbi:MAG: Smr/MutS family protein [Deltaproteobacteria bacterium]|nr:Smr/MutS family protein [Deltaproteobacteria bacterium]